LREIAERFRDGGRLESEVRGMSDEDAIARLTEIKGVGPWTAQGALLLAYQRPDLVRVDDIALRHAVQVQYGLDHLPKPDEVAEVAARWRPYRSLGSSLLLAAAAS
jgi:DNA-3-methyladenine glycosylase II